MKSVCVSVIVPIYNQEAYLDQSILSIMNQTYKNLNVVLVNDGSTDNSLSIIQQYARQDSRITVIDKPNGGLVDAFLTGIHHADGEYACFLDPDDLLGPNYISFFMDQMEDDIDFIASGFYYDNKGNLSPYHLQEDRVYSQEELRRYRDSFLYESNLQISNRFFISRWNKIYRTETLKSMADEIAELKGISLGEDTNFTFLLLNHAKKAKTTMVPNSYFYNIGNQHSMMKSGNLINELDKAQAAYLSLHNFTQKYNTSDSQALALYYFLVESIVQRAEKSSKETLVHISRLLKQNETYLVSKAMMIKTTASPLLRIQQYLQPGFLYRCIRIGLSSLQLLRRTLHKVFTDLKFWFSQSIKKGPIRAWRLLNFQHKREKAFVDLYKKLPLIEQRIKPILEPYLGKSTDLSACPIEKNVFVFWWDGFEHAPAIVQKCLDSIIKHHPDYTVIPIDRNNYTAYTDIDAQILRDFKKDKISVQTFSDILRFNLLKNNGGVWIDATIFFTAPFYLVDDLSNKSFTSLAFSTSADFFTYGEESCSWSGFFIASRKNALFVQVMDEIFKNYYLTYRSYTAYFFIDMALMICKKNKIDGDVLSQTLKTEHSMYTLCSMLGESFHSDIINFTSAIPQKLAWYISNIPSKDTLLGWILEQ